MNEILLQGISVMCIGMGTVVTFLCVTIFAMIIMSNVVGKLNQIFPEVVPQTTGGTQKAISSNDDSEIAAAIVAAMFRK